MIGHSNNIIQISSSSRWISVLINDLRKKYTFLSGHLNSDQLRLSVRPDASQINVTFIFTALLLCSLRICQLEISMLSLCIVEINIMQNGWTQNLRIALGTQKRLLMPVAIRV